MFTYDCQVVRVVDGDTLDLIIDLGFGIFIKERARLYGIDTPEKFGPNASEAGHAATEYVKNWIANRENRGKFVYESIKYDARDKYGRTLGELIWRGYNGDQESLNKSLLIEGLAIKY